MYLRHATKRTKGGTRSYWALVRSARRGGRVVQEVVANLGRLGTREVREASAIARHKLDQLEAERVEAHILVCFLAFCLWKTLEGWQARAGLGSSPRKVLDELRRIQTVDVVIPVVRGPNLRLRCVMQPDEDQACLLERLGLRLPQRLRIPEAAAAHIAGRNVVGTEPTETAWATTPRPIPGLEPFKAG